jgi:hypothetical protein
MQVASTFNVKSATPPKRRYAPYVDLARKMGVAKATNQLIICREISQVLAGMNGRSS